MVEYRLQLENSLIAPPPPFPNPLYHPTPTDPAVILVQYRGLKRLLQLNQPLAPAQLEQFRILRVLVSVNGYGWIAPHFHVPPPATLTFEELPNVLFLVAAMDMDLDAQGRPQQIWPEDFLQWEPD